MNYFGCLDIFFRQRTRKAASGNMDGPGISVRVCPFLNMKRLNLGSINVRSDRVKLF